MLKRIRFYNKRNEIKLVKTVVCQNCHLRLCSWMIMLVARLWQRRKSIISHHNNNVRTSSFSSSWNSLSWITIVKNYFLLLFNNFVSSRTSNHKISLTTSTWSCAYQNKDKSTLKIGRYLSALNWLVWINRNVEHVK